MDKKTTCTNLLVMTQRKNVKEYSLTIFLETVLKVFILLRLNITLFFRLRKHHHVEKYTSWLMKLTQS